jgi:hypothetical protein
MYNKRINKRIVTALKLTLLRNYCARYNKRLRSKIKRVACELAVLCTEDDVLVRARRRWLSLLTSDTDQFNKPNIPLQS